MGIRFSCHMCNQPLHVKDFQAGKRGKCPKCQGSFRVPAKDADFSLAVEDSAAMAVTGKSAAMSSESPKHSSGSKARTPEKVAAAPVARAKSLHPAPSNQTTPSVNPIESEPSPLPASLLPLLEVRWYVRPPSGGQYGPATTQMLLDWIAQKRVTADSLLWHEGLATWLSARELVPEPFGGQVPPSQVAIPPVPFEIPPTAASPVAASPVGVQAAVQAPASTAAVASSAAVGPVSGSATHKAAIAMKKKKQRKQQWMVLGLLLTMAVCLAIVLIVILTRGV